MVELGIPEHQAAIAALQRQGDEARARLRALATLGAAAVAGLDAQAQQQLAANLDELAGADWDRLGHPGLDWGDDRWSAWQPRPSDRPEELRIGRIREQRSGTLLPLAATVPFIGAHGAFVIRSRGPDQAQAAESLLQSLVMRTAVMFPQQARYTLLDPAGNGMAFPMSGYLPRVTPGSGDVRRDLDEVIKEIQRIISTYLDAGTRSFEEIPEEMRLNEAFHFVFAADFPNRYDLRAAEALQSIARTGRPAGVYLFVHHNLDHEPPTDFSRYAIEEPYEVAVTGGETRQHGLAGVVEVEAAPAAVRQKQIFAAIRAAPPLDRPISWDDVAGLAPAEWWDRDRFRADSVIEAPIGRHGANRPLNLWLGEHEREKRPCAHGVIGAMTGSGKSTLFHTLITSLAVRYSPQELRFFLIDGKFGVEFQPYRRLPHADVVSLRTSPDLARSVLAEMVEEMARRNATFVRHGVSGLDGYREAGQPEGNMPRLVLLVDEYQQLFDGDKDGEASALLLRLSQQGRSAGIHMLLASQRFDTPNMLHRTDTFGNIHLRLAMQMAEADMAALTDFGQKGRHLIRASCNRPGRIVLNDSAGDDDANVAGKVALITSERRNEIVERLTERAQELTLPRPVIFNGQAQPELADNPPLQGLVDRDQWLAPAELEDLARRPTDSGGLGVSDWLAPERPLALFLGQEFNVRGHATAVLRRRPNENVMIVGEQHEERVAMLATLLTSAAVCEPPGQLEVLINDRSVQRTGWADVLERTGAVLAKLGYGVTFTRSDGEAAAVLETALAEVERRRSLVEDDRIDEPTMLVVLNEPDRVAALQRVPDDWSMTDSELGIQLKSLVTQGPSVGVHVVVAATSLGVAKSVLAERSIQHDFVTHVAMQMSEDDSFVFVRSSAASKLQLDGDRPVAALLFNNRRQESIKFKPYSIVPAEESDGGYGTLLDQIELAADRLAERLR